MEIEWIAEDYSETLAHATKLSIGGMTTVSPQHTLTNRDIITARHVGRTTGLPTSPLIVAGESLSYQTFYGAGHDAPITNSLTKRLEDRIVPGQINVVFPRIPKSFMVGDKPQQVDRVDELQASALVNIQLEAKTPFIVPPLPSGIESTKVFQAVMERTSVELQTHKSKKEIVGYIPTTNDLALVADMVAEYLKRDIRFFAVDFSSSSLNRALMRTVVSTIRSELKIRGKVGEKTDKQYYLHVFNVASNKKSSNAIAPITDLLMHAYGVDSTSGVMWGGGVLVKDKLRYFNMGDYGAYRVDSLGASKIAYARDLLDGNAKEVYVKLRINRLADCVQESNQIVEKIPNEGAYGYAAYLVSKQAVKNETKKVLMDVQEIKAK